MAELQPIIVFHGSHFIHHLGICNLICVKLLQIMSGVISHNLKKRSLSQSIFLASTNAAYRQAYIQAYRQAHIQAHRHGHRHARTHACTRTRTHTHRDRQTHRHTHTHDDSIRQNAYRQAYRQMCVSGPTAYNQLSSEIDDPSIRFDCFSLRLKEKLFNS